MTVTPYESGDPLKDAGPEDAGLVARRVQALIRRITQDGVGPLSNSVAYAEDRLARARRADRTEEEAREAAIARIVNESVSKAGITGFTTGLGGLVTLPVAIPVGVGGNLVLNTRMVGSIAHLRGYDLHDPQVETMIQLIVAGVSVERALKEFGINLARQAANRAVERAAWATVEAVPGYLVEEAGVRAGCLIVVRYGTSRGAALFSRALPLVGGVIGGVVDGAFAKGIATAAKRAFA